MPTKSLTVGELKKLLDGLPDPTTIVLEIAEPDDSDFAQCSLQKANVEARCDEVDRLYLYGSCEDDDEYLDPIEEALGRGGRLHAFLSGGGLRVVSIKRDGKEMAYGEHPTIAEALRIAGDDFKAGGRPYSEVYGKIETHYLTGQSEPDGPLDAWIRNGSTWDAYYIDGIVGDGGSFIAELHGLEMHKTPDWVLKRVREQRESVRWTDERGVSFEACPCTFANGETGCSVKLVVCPAGMSEDRAWRWDAKRTGRGDSLKEAIEVAFSAPKVEVLSTSEADNIAAEFTKHWFASEASE